MGQAAQTTYNQPMVGGHMGPNVTTGIGGGQGASAGYSGQNAAIGIAQGHAGPRSDQEIR